MLKMIMEKLKIGQPLDIKDPIDYLIDYPSVMNMDQEGRTAMTVSCRDTDYIPKVKDAGKIKKIDGTDVQVMFDGTLVAMGGYHGDWMANIITKLNGHHEPQEEKVFHEVMKRVRPNTWMVELGSFWAFYSILFNKNVDKGQNVCCEPDPQNMEIGKKNASLNNVELNFVDSAVGTEDGLLVDVVMDSDPTLNRKVPVRTVDSIVKEYGIKQLEILHMDVQGFELEGLHGASESIKSGKVRFVFISTHHYLISQNPNIHAECLKFVKDHGGNIITAHTIAESYSGDGLIVASFNSIDDGFTVSTSINHTDNSLFRPHESDLQILVDYQRSLKTK